MHQADGNIRPDHSDEHFEKSPYQNHHGDSDNNEQRRNLREEQLAFINRASATLFLLLRGILAGYGIQT
eukprot:4715894-Ditylum_brightwellii.AAC.1